MHSRKRGIYFRISLNSGRRLTRCYREDRAVPPDLISPMEKSGQELFGIEASRLPVSHWFAKWDVAPGKSHLWHAHGSVWRHAKEEESGDPCRNRTDIIPGYQTSVRLSQFESKTVHPAALQSSQMSPHVAVKGQKFPLWEGDTSFQNIHTPILLSTVQLKQRTEFW